MEIAICDDHLQDLEHLAASLEGLIKQQQLDICIARYDSSDAFLARVAEAGAPAISYLDIYLGDTSGVALARAVRKADQRAAIVFVTRSREHMAEGFEVGAVHYLVKPWSDEDLAQSLQRALLITGMPSRSLEITVSRQKIFIPHDHILYVESRDKRCHIFLKSGEEHITRGQLPRLEVQLHDESFLCCHQSFLVNMNFIKTVCKGNFILHSGQLIPIRSSNRNEAVSQYEAYRFNRIRRLP